MIVARSEEKLMKCKGIWSNEPCPDNAEAMPGREYCGACWNVGEDMMREAELDKDEAREYAQTPRVNPATGWSDVESCAAVGMDELDDYPEPDDPDDSAGGFEYPHLSDDDFRYGGGSNDF
jgi:hypothetical protein